MSNDPASPIAGFSTHSSFLRHCCDSHNQIAWSRFIATYGDYVQRIARSACISHADAEDIAQEVMIRVAATLCRFILAP